MKLCKTKVQQTLRQLVLSCVLVALYRFGERVVARRRARSIANSKIVP